MATQEETAVLPLEQVDAAAAFPGFDPEDFAVFEIPEFAARMAELRARLRPKLLILGDALTPRLSAALGQTLYPHVPRHLRRSVNPPEETWAAFSPSPRSYKPFVHLRCAISADKVRVTVFVEDDATDKQAFAAGLGRKAGELGRHFALHPTVLAYQMLDPTGEPLRGHALDTGLLQGFADRLSRVKSQHAVFGIAFDRAHPIVADGPEFIDAVVNAAVVLRPIYDCGRTA